MATAKAIPSSTGYSPLDTVLDRLDRLKATGPGTWSASCPTSNHKHGDRSRGLSVREGDDGRVLLHCHGGCSVHEVVAALGIELSDLFPVRQIDYPHQAPHKGIIGRNRIKRINWRDLFEAIERDLTVCSLAFSDMANGKHFSQSDAATIAKMADHLASEIAEVIHA
jgi:hypothetical protein